MPSIYVDLLLFLNGFIDALLLSATAALRHLPHTRRRLCLGAAVGALSSLILLLPPLPTALVIGADLLFAALMVRCTFAWHTARDYAASVGVLFALSAGFSGACGLLWYWLAPDRFFVQNGAVYYDVSPLMLLGCTLLCYAASRGIEAVLHRTPAAKTLTLIAENRGQTVEFFALHDTGFSLCDTFSGNPVVLVDKTAAAPLLPADFGAPGTGFRLIPCHTVTGDSLLYAFRPERLALVSDGGETPLSGALLALSDRLQNEAYSALCGDDVANLII